MPEEIKVLICTDGIFPHSIGGMQRHSRFLIESLSILSGIQVSVIHPHNTKVFPDEPFIDEIYIQGIDSTKNYLKESYQYSKRIFAVIQKYPQHIIYSQGLCVWYGIEKIGKRVIVNPHGLEPFQAIGLKDKIIAIPFKRVFKKIFSNAGKVVSLGGNLTNILSRNIKEAHKIVELPNGVQLPAIIEKNFNEQELTFLFVSRFAGNKGIHILFSAIDELALTDKRFEKWTFLLAGKGPLYEKCLSENKHGNVKLLGFITDEQLFKLYEQTHCFILPTLFEGMPTVILEAMAYSSPVIASDTGAISVLVNESNGYLIEKNNPTVLKKAILSFIALSTMEKKSLSHAARVKAEEFTWKRIANLHMEAFNKMVIKN